MFDARTIIEKKRDKKELSPKEIHDFVMASVHGSCTRAQIAAFLSFGYANGFGVEETVSLTQAMTSSGRRLKWESGSPLCDKHSTGGVGDKVSLILAPLWVALGARVPMISGRGLGHTGGTLDKLESIDGFQTSLSESHLKQQLSNVGCFIAAQTGEIAPADKIFYALRNETATVSCIPLIVASILSKKLAEGIDNLVMDVKWGKGAFMKTLSKAKELSSMLELVGTKAGLKMRTVHTQTDEPLGKAVGNALEVQESIQCLKGEGPADLHHLVCDLVGDPKASEVLSSGAAYPVFEQMVRAQGGSLDVPLLGGGTFEHVVVSSKSGVVSECDAYKVGMSVVRLGGGRVREQDAIDPGVGVWVEKKIGETIEKGEPLFRVIHRERGFEEALSLLSQSIVIV